MTRHLQWLSALVVAVLACATLASPADARSGTAPVTAPDTVTAYAENYVFAKVLANDSDAEGDKLTICGLAPQRYPRIRADSKPPKIKVRPVPGAHGKVRATSKVLTRGHVRHIP